MLGLKLNHISKGAPDLVKSQISEIWQAPRQHCCRGTCQLSERSNLSLSVSRNFEIWRWKVLCREWMRIKLKWTWYKGRGIYLSVTCDNKKPSIFKITKNRVSLRNVDLCMTHSFKGWGEGRVSYAGLGVNCGYEGLYLRQGHRN